MLEKQLMDIAAVQKLKSLTKRDIEIPPLKKITTPSRIKLHARQLENFIKYLETGNFSQETLARFNSLEQVCEKINSNPELQKLYNEYLEKELSKAQRAYFGL